MSMMLKIELIIIAIGCLIFIVYSVRKRNIDLKYSLVWMLSGFLMVLFAIIPNLIENISILLGFEKASNMVFCFAIVSIFFILFNLTTIVTVQSRKITNLIQEISILNKKVKEIEDKIEIK